MKPLIHGEIVFKPVKVMPKGETAQHNEFIAGHSETGHHHVVTSKKKFDVLEDETLKSLYIQVFEPAEVIHQKSFDVHETKTLGPGIYEIFHATEYDPFQKVVRRIWD